MLLAAQGPGNAAVSRTRMFQWETRLRKETSGDVLGESRDQSGASRPLRYSVVISEGAPHVPGTVPARPVAALSEFTVAHSPGRGQMCVPPRSSSSPERNKAASEVSLQLAAGGYSEPSEPLEVTSTD